MPYFSQLAAGAICVLVSVRSSIPASDTAVGIGSSLSLVHSTGPHPFSVCSQCFWKDERKEAAVGAVVIVEVNTFIARL